MVVVDEVDEVLDDVVEDDVVGGAVVVVVLGGPDETTMTTVLPGFWTVPIAGLVEMTLPASTTVDEAYCWVTLNPRSCSFIIASDGSIPATSGITTGSGPVETMSVTIEPLSAFCPPAGF